MNDIRDEMDLPQPASKPVIVLGGDGYSAENIERLLAEKGFAGEQYVVLTRDEATQKGLLQDALPPTPFPHRLPKIEARWPNPERDRWNAAVDEKKAAKRRAKGKP